MLQYSLRLVVATLDAEGNVISRNLVSPGKSYTWSQKAQAEADAKNVHLEANQRIEFEQFLDTSRYEAGWAQGLIF